MVYTRGVAEPDTYLREIEDLAAQNLRQPLAIVGFGGWIDAGFAATGAVKYLVEHMAAERIADLDPEPFYAFTDTRPRVSHPAPGRRLHLRAPRLRRDRGGALSG